MSAPTYQVERGHLDEAVNQLGEDRSAHAFSARWVSLHEGWRFDQAEEVTPGVLVVGN